MASIFDQRPQSFQSWGYPGSRFVQKILKQGFAPNAEVTAVLFGYNQAGQISDDELKEELQPSILPVDADNVLLVLAGEQTRKLRDPKYWLEYAVDGTVQGVTEIRFTRELPTAADAALRSDKIEIGAGTDTLLIRNPDAVTGAYFDFRQEPILTTKPLFHNLGTDLLVSDIFDAEGQRRGDFSALPLRDEPDPANPGQVLDFRNWCYIEGIARSGDGDAIEIFINPRYR